MLLVGLGVSILLDGPMLVDLDCGHFAAAVLVALILALWQAPRFV
ncbi:MAG: hypothetical protein AAFX81_00400 [Pseudomonadota bacterium]